MYILGKMRSGSEHSLFYTLFGIFDRPKINISGFVKPGYEKVREVFEKNFKDGMERGSQCVVYVKGEKVVDLSGTFNIDNYDKNSLQIIFSSSKCVSGLVMTMLVDRGLLQFGQKVVEVWPEFGKNGKENITIEDVLKHESGLVHLAGPINNEHIQRENIKNNSIGKIIEDSKLSYNFNIKRNYHGISRGYILSEIVRRVDPQGRTMGEFVRDEISRPLGIDFYFGLEGEEQKERFWDLQYTNHSRTMWSLLQGFVPWSLGRKITNNGILHFFFMIYMELIIFLTVGVKFRCPKYKFGEVPSANGVANADALAKIAAVLAVDGTFGETTLLRKESIDEAHSNAEVKFDLGIMKHTKLTKAGWNIYSNDQSVGTYYEAAGFVGWQGLSGSVLNWNRELEIGFGYAPNICDTDHQAMKGLKLRKAVYDCVKNLQNS